MIHYSLPADQMRSIVSCNPNSHTNIRHPDRIMAEHDLVYIVSGEWVIAQNGEAYTLRPGDVILLLAGEHHCGPVACQGEVRTMFVHFSACPEDRIVSDPATRKGSFALPIVTAVPAGSPIPALMEQLISAYWGRDIHAQARADAYLQLVLCELSALSTGEAVAADKAELVQRLIRMMESNPARFYTVPELSAMIHVSEKTLHNYFRQTIGQSPHACQLALKLDAARRRITDDPTLRLRDVAQMYGFCDQYHFSKLYKARFGMPPKGKA